MGKRTLVELFDDVDGSVIPEGKGEHIELTVNGASYEIDLSAKNAKEFHKAVGYYTERAARVGGRRRPKSVVKRAGQSASIREWAKAHGHSVSPRGRISAEVVAAYEEAQARRD